MQLPGHSERLDVPRTLRELYPHARARRRLRVTAPGQMRRSDRGMRWLRRGIESIVLVVVAVPLLLASRGERGVGLGMSAASATGRSLFRTVARWIPWQRWARARGATLTRELPTGLDAIPPGELELPEAEVPSYRVVVGARRIGVELCAVASRSSVESHHGAYVATFALPSGVARRFPASSFVRRRGIGLIDSLAPIGEPIGLESIRLHDGASLHVQGGEHLDWQQLLDPALVDLLAEGIHVEWHQLGERVLLHTPAPMSALEVPDAERLDALCVAAVALERRFARIAGDGRSLPAADVAWVVERSDARVRRHLARERSRDLTMDVEEQFAELARFASDAEVDDVRARVEAGTFPLEWLDDLVHHRRAAFWGARDDAADADADAA